MTTGVVLSPPFTNSIRSLGPLGEPLDLGWAARKDQPKLKAAAAAFLES